MAGEVEDLNLCFIGVWWRSSFFELVAGLWIFDGFADMLVSRCVPLLSASAAVVVVVVVVVVVIVVVAAVVAVVACDVGCSLSDILVVGGMGLVS